MPTRRGNNTYYYLDEASQTFGTHINTLLLWVNTGQVKSRREGSPVLIEEQSLRACIARHKGDKR